MGVDNITNPQTKERMLQLIEGNIPYFILEKEEIVNISKQITEHFKSLKFQEMKTFGLKLSKFLESNFSCEIFKEIE